MSEDPSSETDVAPPKGGDKAEAEQAQGGRPPGVEELGGPKGPEPTRFGDWEKGGRCSDF